MSNGNGRNQDFSSYLLPAVVGLLVILAVAYYFMKVRKAPHELPATPVATAPATTPTHTAK